MKRIHCMLIGSLLLASCGHAAKPLFDVSKMPETPVFDIETTNGTLRVQLYAETPGHRDNFLKLAAERYYDGILFHRVIKGFMIQAGQTGATPTRVQLKYGGKTGVNYTIPAEFVPGLTHKRGALAAARTNNPEKASSGSQFYIVHNEDRAAPLNGDYTVFGEVVGGFEVIDSIANEPVSGEKPVKEVKILSVKPVNVK